MRYNVWCKAVQPGRLRGVPDTNRCVNEWKSRSRWGCATMEVVPVRMLDVEDSGCGDAARYVPIREFYEVRQDLMRCCRVCKQKGRQVLVGGSGLEVSKRETWRWA